MVTGSSLANILSDLTSLSDLTIRGVDMLANKFRHLKEHPNYCLYFSNQINVWQSGCLSYEHMLEQYNFIKIK